MQQYQGTVVRFAMTQNSSNLQKISSFLLVIHRSYLTQPGKISLTLTNFSPCSKYLHQLADFSGCKFIMIFLILKNRLNDYRGIWISPSTKLSANWCPWVIIKWLFRVSKHFLCWCILWGTTYCLWWMTQNMSFKENEAHCVVKWILRKILITSQR